MLRFLRFGVLSVANAVYGWQRQRSTTRSSDQPGLSLRGQGTRQPLRLSNVEPTTLE